MSEQTTDVRSTPPVGARLTGSARDDLDVLDVDPRGQVHQNLDVLDRHLSLLGEALGVLEDRLGPVLTQQYEGDGEKGDECAVLPSCSPLAARIGESADVLDRRLQFVRSIIDRLEV